MRCGCGRVITMMNEWMRFEIDSGLAVFSFVARRVHLQPPKRRDMHVYMHRVAHTNIGQPV